MIKDFVEKNAWNILVGTVGLIVLFAVMRDKVATVALAIGNHETRILVLEKSDERRSAFQDEALRRLDRIERKIDKR